MYVGNVTFAEKTPQMSAPPFWPNTKIVDSLPAGSIITELMPSIRRVYSPQALTSNSYFSGPPINHTVTSSLHNEESATFNSGGATSHSDISYNSQHQTSKENSSSGANTDLNTLLEDPKADKPCSASRSTASQRSNAELASSKTPKGVATRKGDNSVSPFGFSPFSLTQEILALKTQLNEQKCLVIEKRKEISKIQAFKDQITQGWTEVTRKESEARGRIAAKQQRIDSMKKELELCMKAFELASQVPRGAVTPSSAASVSAASVSDVTSQPVRGSLPAGGCRDARSPFHEVSANTRTQLRCEGKDSPMAGAWKPDRDAPQPHVTTTKEMNWKTHRLYFAPEVMLGEVGAEMPKRKSVKNFIRDIGLVGAKSPDRHCADISFGTS